MLEWVLNVPLMMTVATIRILGNYQKSGKSQNLPEL